MVAWTTYSLTTPVGQSSERAVYAAIVAADGTVGTEFRVNTPPLASLGSVLALQGGGFVVTYSQGTDVYAQLFDAAGAMVGNEFRINETQTGSQSVADYSTLNTVAQLADGTLVFTWYGSGVGDNSGVFTRSFTPPSGPGDDGINDVPIAIDDIIEVGTGETFVDVLVDLNDSDADGDARIVTAVSIASHGMVAINPDGTIRYTPNPGYLGEDLFTYTISDGHGGTDTATVRISIPNREVQINTYDTAAQYDSSLAVLAGGGFVVTWTSNGQDGSGGGVYAQRYDANNAASGAEFRVATSTAGSQSDSSVVALSNGNFLVSWTSTDSNFTNDDVYARLYDAAGNTLVTQFRVNTVTSNSQDESRVVALADGRFVIAWQSGAQDGSGTGVYAQLYTAAGVRDGTPFLVNTTTDNNQDMGDMVRLADGGFLITFRTYGTPDSTLSYQRFDAEGTRLGGETNIAAAPSIGLPTATALSDGGFVIAWDRSADLFGQRFDAAGIADGAVFAISDPFDSASNARLIALAGGAFVAVWSTFESAGETTVRAQVYDAAGAPFGDEFVVSQTEAGRQEAIGTVIGATLADGSLLITWSGEGSGDDSGVYYRRFLLDLPATPTPGNDVITGTGGADVIDLSAGGNDSVNGGGGDDGFYFGAAFDGNDRTDGGAGTLDQLGLQGNYPGLTLGEHAIDNVEMLVFLSGSDTRFGDTAGNAYHYVVTTVNANVAAGQQLTLSFNMLSASESMTFDGSLETNGSFRTYGGLGSDRLTGGQQNDAFHFGPGRWGATDTVDGQGGGLDQLVLQGNYAAASAIVVGAGQIRSIELITLISASDTSQGGSFDYDLTMHDDNVGVGQALRVDGSRLRAGEQLSFDGSTESASAYLVQGGASADTIRTGGGADTITGGGDADQLWGGAGGDIFAYLATADSLISARDRIEDFTSGDRIDLSAIDANSVAGGVQDFAFIGAAGFTAAGQLRAYQSGGIWYVDGDTNGDGMADISIQVAAATGYAWSGADFIL
ncbi:MAG: hypothetical protein EOP58_00580 [Sphingomonadales bacterium]|nr:MAG: hypothetical protein EOP58_00580 [Sphingomonadales bacterium]